jgi:hypothetical protein
MSPDIWSFSVLYVIRTLPPDAGYWANLVARKKTPGSEDPGYNILPKRSAEARLFRGGGISLIARSLHAHIWRGSLASSL